MGWDKIIIQTKGIKLEIDNLELQFQLLEKDYDSDGDKVSELFKIKQLVEGAEKLREEFDLKLQIKWEQYQETIKHIQNGYNKLKEENDKLKQKLVDGIIK